MTTVGLTAPSARAGAASPAMRPRVRSSMPSAPPGSRRSSPGSKRAKWMDTPGGAIRYSSGSMVGLPGGTSTPMRPRQPYIAWTSFRWIAPGYVMARSMHTLLFLDPGHFHAALALRAANPRVADEIVVYAPDGPDLRDFLALIERFNRRHEAPTRWRPTVVNDGDPLARLIGE